MDSNHKPYDWEASFKRLDEILNQSDLNYEEVDTLPDRDKLTFTNGFYANCSALFVDIRGSSKLPQKMKRPTLARLYRSYISELVAVMNGDVYCREVNIVGDAVWCVVNTPRQTDIDDVFSTACIAHSLIRALNCKLARKGIERISVGIGMDWGRALMIKAGYSGSGINDVVYMGDVVNSAAKLAAKGGMGPFESGPLVAGGNFFHNLNAHNKGLLGSSSSRVYSGSAVNTAMDEWYQEHCG